MFRIVNFLSFDSCSKINIPPLQESSAKRFVQSSTARQLMEQAVHVTYKNEPPMHTALRLSMAKTLDSFQIPQHLEILENRIVDEAAEFQRTQIEHEQLYQKYSTVLNFSDENEKMYVVSFMASWNACGKVAEKWAESSARRCIIFRFPTKLGFSWLLGLWIHKIFIFTMKLALPTFKPHPFLHVWDKLSIFARKIVIVEKWAWWVGENYHCNGRSVKFLNYGIKSKLSSAHF